MNEPLIPERRITTYPLQPASSSAYHSIVTTRPSLQPRISLIVAANAMEVMATAAITTRR